MEILDETVTVEYGCVVTIGAFDGVHLGHQALIARTRERAAQLRAPSAVVTFDRHPAAVVRPLSAPKLLSDLGQKLDLLAQTGLDYAVVIAFDEQRSQELAEDFITKTLVGRLKAKSIVVGPDFHFGRKRAGTIELLRQMGEQHGYTVEECDVVSAHGASISSTAIRRFLQDGEIEQATGLMGRPYEMRGTVMHGDGRGRSLGYPTANVAVGADILTPLDGVYVGEYALPSGKTHVAAVSIGTRPMFYENGETLVEAHLIDFDGDLYDQQARVTVSSRLRGQEHFDSLETLIAQIGRDVDQVKRHSRR